MNKKQIAITLGITCLFLTMAICIQINTVKKANTTVAQTFTENSLRDEVLRWKEKNDNISEQIDLADKRLAKVREQATQNDTASSDVEKQINLNNYLLGLTNLEGTGVEITVKDDPQATNIGIFEDISDHIVHDADLRALVNDLKNAGAEAISINGQRLVNTTAITCIRKCN